MKRWTNISSLGSVSVAVCALSALAFSFASCGTTNDIPIDDAYIWAEKTPTPEPTPKPKPAAQPAVSTPTPTPEPGMHILYEKDTTITVRIIR